jgi:hypothetical protein
MDAADWTHVAWFVSALVTPPYVPLRAAGIAWSSA